MSITRDLRQNSLQKAVNLFGGLCTLEKRIAIQTVKPCLTQILRHPTRRDSLSQTLYNRSGVQSVFTNENRVVLLATGENLDEGTNRSFAEVQNIESTLACKFRKV